MKVKHKNFFEYLFLILTIGITGFPIIYKNYFEPVLISLFLAQFIYFISYRISYPVKYTYIFVFIFIFILIILAHAYLFEIFVLKTYLGVILRILNGALLLVNLNKTFVEKYINTIYYFGIISLVFYIPLLLLPNLLSILISFAPFKFGSVTVISSYLVYNLNVIDPDFVFPRNSGPFWEPGAFSGFLNIALIFALVKGSKFISKRNIIIILCIITTFSTTGYLGLFLIVLLAYYLKEGLTNKSILPIFIIILISLFTYLEVPFLHNKINHFINKSETEYSYLGHRTRFSSAIIDLNDLKTSPVFGRGPRDETRHSDYLMARNRNNGTTDFLVQYGVLGFITFFLFYYFSLKNIVEVNSRISKSLISFLIVLIIFILGFSEAYFHRPFFWALCFLFIR